MKDLNRSLSEHTPAMLKAIAHGWGAALPEGDDTIQMAGALAAQMLSAEALKAVISALSAEETRALAFVAAQGICPTRRLIREFGEIERLGPGRLERDQPWLSPASPAERLWYLGLIYYAYDTVGEYRGEVYYIPTDLRALLPPLPHSVPAFQLEPAAAPASALGDEIALARDLLALLVYLRREKVPVRTMPFLSRQDVSRLQPYLVDAQPAADAEQRLLFMQRLLQRAGLIVREGALLRPSLKAREWLQASPMARARLLYETWRDDRAWNELEHIADLAIQNIGGRNYDPRLGRHKILNHLLHAKPGQWYALDSLIGSIKRVDADFLRPDGDYDSWYIRDASGKRYLSGFQNWGNIEGALIGYLVRGPLLWLGLAQIGSVEPLAFRLTALGAALLGVPWAPLPDLPERPLVIQSDFTVTVPREANLYDHYLLSRLADWLSQDQVTLYRITDRSIWRGLQEGIEIGAILAFLRRASAEQVPQNVARSLQDWGARFGQIKLSSVVLLTVRDEQTMRELRALPQVQPFIKEIVSPLAALVDGRQKDELIQLLKKLGYWPDLKGLDS